MLKQGKCGPFRIATHKIRGKFQHVVNTIQLKQAEQVISGFRSMTSKCMISAFLQLLDNYDRCRVGESAAFSALFCTTFWQDMSFSVLKFSENKSKAVPPSWCDIHIYIYMAYQ